DRVGPLRTGPWEHDDPVTGIGRPMDRHAATTLVVIDAQAADPGDEGIDRQRPRPGRDRGAQMHEGMTRRTALAVPGPTPPDGDLQLDDRLEPVDVRALEQPDLDESHGPARIASTDRPERAVAPARRVFAPIAPSPRAIEPGRLADP